MLGIRPQAAYRWFREGTLPVPAVRMNQRTVLVSPDAPAGPAAWSQGLYARVSSYGQKAGLDRQVARLTSWAAGAGSLVVQVGFGVNGSRAKVRRLLAGPDVTAVVIGHRDRPGRMNTEPAGAALWAHGRRVVVPGDGEAGDDLAGDMAGVLTWFCARLHGRVPAGNRALEAVGCARRGIGPRAVSAGNVVAGGQDGGVMTGQGA